MISCMYLAQITKQMQKEAGAISHLKTPPMGIQNAEEIKALLTKHGCTMQEYPDHDNITFPSGTMRRRGMRLGVSERYDILLPDGYIIHEIYDTVRELSFLAFPREVRS